MEVVDSVGLGAGLVVLSFWLFIAAVSVAGIWDGAKKREQEHETLRRILESNRDLDTDTLDKLMSLVGGSGRPDRDFKVAAMWILPISPGVAVLGYFISRVAEEAFYPLMGVAGILAIMGIGFWIAGNVTASWYRADQDGHPQKF